MLNWVETRERLPTEADANTNGHVLAIDGCGIRVYAPSNVGHNGATHWLDIRTLPMPRKWRTATIHDLAKAGKPIPCRVRDGDKNEWYETHLVAVSVAATQWPFVTELYDEDSDSFTWKQCEILEQE